MKVTRYKEENDELQRTINDLIDKITDYLDGTDFEPYSFSYKKKRLIDQFRDRIIITKLDSKSNVVTFRSTSDNILHQFNVSQKQEDIVSEKFKIIETAASPIKNGIKILRTNSSIYPSSDIILFDQLRKM